MSSKHDPYDLLHSSARKEHLVDQDEHMFTACYLSRALWLLLFREGDDAIDMEDERNRMAVSELASIVAFHASAAVTVMRVEDEAARHARS
ncbi:hypothetical protein SAMN06265338_102220 [Rhodoblastus acidophilus]|uniref:Uncharacterized protein n=1 Tax=Rhodoblastus acidophilus TaxID=1074 RepID=A0A212R0C3_RHOAC|nr:hypothetical protein [Rhodoblastus acidophilus]RAI23046.1 hypothetical protein CH337_04215 [Rhodoblastus acidophilus]SNB65448.1 hypothetical protein SAMN06265338_102220 [Rhodoblastus acidophilus]